MKKTQKDKILISFSFYHEGKEFIVEAETQAEARILFNKLIQEYERNSKA